MYSHVIVNFPNTNTSPLYVYSMSFYQNKYEHEVASLVFRDWDVSYDSVEAGSPIEFNIKNNNNSRTFYGYVDHVKVHRDPGSFLTEVVVVGASYILKNEDQRVFKGMSADAIIQQIATENGFVAFTVSCPRVYPQVSQAGHTNWELMVRLAKQNGYSLRAENTELYFQPMMYEYTNKRAEAYKFVLRDPNDPSGSTLYSFVYSIGENVDHNGDKKAAIAISGIDAANNSSVSITKQIRNKNTRTRTSPEIFDKFATDIVATTSEVAAYESEAADNRNLFPYRGTAEVLGNPSLRPDMPVYLEGLGLLYSGYWTILGVEHRIVETERNTQTYTTILHVGSDSLGLAATWTDGQTITEPDYKPSRTIISGIRQTNIKPKTSLLTTAINVGPQSVGKLSKITNRSIPKINKQAVASPVWKTKTTTLNPISVSTKSTASTANRLLKKVPKI